MNPPQGEGGKIWENGNETCKISCRKRVFFLRNITSEYYLSPILGFERDVFCMLVSKLSGIFKA